MEICKVCGGEKIEPPKIKGKPYCRYCHVPGDWCWCGHVCDSHKKRQQEME